jgi:hypothetical protein
MTMRTKTMPTIAANAISDDMKTPTQPAIIEMSNNNAK